jgi:hypothetical protein
MIRTSDLCLRRATLLPRRRSNEGAEPPKPAVVELPARVYLCQAQSRKSSRRGGRRTAASRPRGLCHAGRASSLPGRTPSAVLTAGDPSLAGTGLQAAKVSHNQIHRSAFHFRHRPVLALSRAILILNVGGLNEARRVRGRIEQHQFASRVQHVR